ncbi:MAG: NifB/NifX family molybdenum-iron cluster-binding protein [Armatimonadota bacterium]
MRIAVASNSDDIDDGRVTRLGTCSHLLIVDSDTMDYEAIEIPAAEQGRGAGIRIVTLAAGHGAGAIMATHVASRMEQALQGSGIDLVAGVDGSVREAVEEYAGRSRSEVPQQGATFALALRQSVRQFGRMLPVLFGVMLLAGLLNAFVSRQALEAIFTGRPFIDTLWGAVSGSIFGGNAVNSYVIGAALRDAGVSLFAVTALIVTWVTVGLIQLPAEAAALGTGFTIARNLVAFIVSLGVAMLTVLVAGWFA